MTFNPKNFFSPAAFTAIKTAGMHRLMGAMHGQEELGLKEAVFLLATKNYIKQAEYKIIRSGIESYKKLVG